jgi:hypothetical protein
VEADDLNAVDRGALLIDIRSSGDRERDGGVVPGSLHIPRTVLNATTIVTAGEHGDAFLLGEVAGRLPTLQASL